MIRSLHGVQDVEKYQSLLFNMETNGWTGRPILVIDMGDYMQALTGSHRIAAASELGVEIPVSIIDVNEMCIDLGWDIDMIMRDLDGFCLDLRDYDAERAELLSQDL